MTKNITKNEYESMHKLQDFFQKTLATAQVIYDFFTDRIIWNVSLFRGKLFSLIVFNYLLQKQFSLQYFATVVSMSGETVLRQKNFYERKTHNTYPDYEDVQHCQDEKWQDSSHQKSGIINSLVCMCVWHSYYQVCLPQSTVGPPALILGRVQR